MMKRALVEAIDRWRGGGRARAGGRGTNEVRSAEILDLLRTHFARIEELLDRIDTRLDELIGRIDALDQRVTRIEGRMGLSETC